MSCETFEPMIALDAGGDLPAADAEQLARHLAACADCRRFAGEMRESQRAIALLADVPMDAEVLAAVRTGVLRQVEDIDGQRSTIVPFRLPARALALAAALAVALGALFLLRSGGPIRTTPGAPAHELGAPPPRVAETPVTPRPPTGLEPIAAEPSPAATPIAADRIEEATPDPPDPMPPVTVPPVTWVATAAMPATATATATPATQPPVNEPMIIKLVSEEADVVIYWFVPTPTEATKETNT